VFIGLFIEDYVSPVTFLLASISPKHFLIASKRIQVAIGQRLNSIRAYDCPGVGMTPGACLIATGDTGDLNPRRRVNRVFAEAQCR
jgi:hypothetical protein